MPLAAGRVSLLTLVSPCFGCPGFSPSACSVAWSQTQLLGNTLPSLQCKQTTKLCVTLMTQVHDILLPGKKLAFLHQKRSQQAQCLVCSPELCSQLGCLHVRPSLEPLAPLWERNRYWRHFPPHCLNVQHFQPIAFSSLLQVPSSRLYPTGVPWHWDSSSHLSWST